MKDNFYTFSLTSVTITGLDNTTWRSLTPKEQLGTGFQVCTIETDILNVGTIYHPQRWHTCCSCEYTFIINIIISGMSTRGGVIATLHNLQGNIEVGAIYICLYCKQVHTKMPMLKQHHKSQSELFSISYEGTEGGTLWLWKKALWEGCPDCLQNLKVACDFLLLWLTSAHLYVCFTFAFARRFQNILEWPIPRILGNRKVTQTYQCRLP